MAYHRETTLVARRGYSGLGATDALSIKGVVTQNATLWTTAAGGKSASFPIPKGTTITVVEVSSSGGRVKIGGAVGKFYGYWLDRESVTEAAGTLSKIGGAISDFFKGAGGAAVKGAAGTMIDKYGGGGGAAATPGGGISARGSLLTTRNVAIAGGAVVLLALVLRGKKGH